MKCRIIYSVRRRRAQFKRLLHVRKRRAQKEPSNFAHSSGCAPASTHYLLLALQTPSSRGQISQRFLPPNAPFMEKRCAKKKCVSFDACSVAWFEKENGWDAFHIRRNAASLLHTESSCLVKENGYQ